MFHLVSNVLVPMKVFVYPASLEVREDERCINVPNEKHHRLVFRTTANSFKTTNSKFNY